MKRCFKCGETKPLSEFYRHPKMADGYLGKCKDCAKKDVRDNYSAKREQYSQYEHARNKTRARRAPRIGYQRKRRKKDPLKTQARAIFAMALKAGKIQKKPCEVCGNPKVEGHHADYSRPLDVKWLCFRCHCAEHGKVAIRVNFSTSERARLYWAERRKATNGNQP